MKKVTNVSGQSHLTLRPPTPLPQLLPVVHYLRITSKPSSGIHVWAWKRKPTSRIPPKAPKTTTRKRSVHDEIQREVHEVIHVNAMQRLRFLAGPNHEPRTRGRGVCVCVGLCVCRCSVPEGRGCSLVISPRRRREGGSPHATKSARENMKTNCSSICRKAITRPLLVVWA